MFYTLGVRYMTLTSTCHTPWADSSSADAPKFDVKHNGLTDFGKVSALRPQFVVDYRINHINFPSNIDTRAPHPFPKIAFLPSIQAGHQGDEPPGNGCRPIARFVGHNEGCHRSFRCAGDILALVCLRAVQFQPKRSGCRAEIAGQKPGHYHAEFLLGVFELHAKCNC